MKGIVLMGSPFATKLNGRSQMETFPVFSCVSTDAAAEFSTTEAEWSGLVRAYVLCPVQKSRRNST
jgi:hypothetical protein